MSALVKIAAIDLPSFDVSFSTRFYMAIGFGVFLLAIIVIGLILGIRSIIRGRKYERESLPTLVDLNLAEKEEEPEDDPTLAAARGESTFSISEDDEDSGDEDANSLLREVKNAEETLPSEDEQPKKTRRGLFGRRRSS